MKKRLRANALSMVFLLISAGLIWFLADHLTARRQAPPTVILIPLDSRPVNTDLPQLLAGIAGIPVTLPKRESLDQFLTPAKSAQLFTWLEEQNESGCDITIIHINELLFGGLLNSRDSAQYLDASQKLQSMFDYLLRRNRNPSNRLILVYIMPRLLPSQYDEVMWAYETELPELSQLRHRLSLNPGDAGLAAQIRGLEAKIPREIRTRYESVYTEAFNAGLSMLDWLSQGLVDEVVIGLDDSAEYGLNVKAFNDLKAEADRREQKYAYFLHGADELSPLIIARHGLDYAAGGDNFTLRYLTEGQEQTILPYEALPLIDNFGEKAAYLQDEKPGRKAGAAPALPVRPKYIYVFTDREASPEQMRAAWDAIRTDQERPRRSLIGLTDAAKVNGAWAPFIESVGPVEVYDYVDAYAGWNTAGNSLGTVMAHLMFWEAAQSFPVREKRDAALRHENLQKLRIVDDYFYQSKVRQDLIAWTVREGFPYLSFGGRWMEADDMLREMMQAALAPLPKMKPGILPSLGGGEAEWQFKFPWPRSFEILATIQEKDMADR